MPNRNDIINHSEEMQEIMGHIPKWIIRSGSTMIFIILISILSGSYFIKYPEIIFTSIIITTSDQSLVLADSTGNINVIGKTIVPSSKIGKIKVGQKVNIKLKGYPFMEYGMLIGKVNYIDITPVEHGYFAEITLVSGLTSTLNKDLKFYDQMDGSAEIIINETRLISRFIKPLKTIMKRENKIDQ